MDGAMAMNVEETASTVRLTEAKDVVDSKGAASTEDMAKRFKQLVGVTVENPKGDRRCEGDVPKNRSRAGSCPKSGRPGEEDDEYSEYSSYSDQDDLVWV